MPAPDHLLGGSPPWPPKSLHQAVLSALLAFPEVLGQCSVCAQAPKGVQNLLEVDGASPLHQPEGSLAAGPPGALNPLLPSNSVVRVDVAALQ